MDQIFTDKGEFNIDVNNVIKTCVNQFSDDSRWIVELILNSYDASATKIVVTAEETEDGYSVTVSDDGHGMDLIAAEKCISKFSSEKKSENAIGEFGLGLISPGHDNSQRKMHIISHTDQQINEIVIDGNITRGPGISLRSDPSYITGTGTVVTVEFAKPSRGFSLRRTLNVLKDYAGSKLQYLPVDIAFELPKTETEEASTCKIGFTNWINGGYEYILNIDTNSFDIVFTTGRNVSAGIHAYHKKVLVTKDFNSMDLQSIPCMEIRINSNYWTLPIGRDKIILTTVSERIINKLKEIIVTYCYPMVFDELRKSNPEEEIIESIAINFLSKEFSGPWTDFPLFKTLSSRKPYLSYDELRKITEGGNFIYFVENSRDVTGMDLKKIFPVIDSGQKYEKKSFVQEKFKEHIRIIKSDSGIYVVPVQGNDYKRERFQKSLKFDFTQLMKTMPVNKKSLQMDYSPVREDINKRIDNNSAKQRNDALLDKILSLKFEVGYLINSSNSSPNTDYKFYYNNLLTVFNLNHPEIRHLINYKDPKLAGHRALFIALTEKNGVLNDLRFNPLIVDAILAVDLLARFNSQDKNAFNQVLFNLNDLLNREN